MSQQKNAKKLPWTNKKLGQHYLKEEMIIERICRDQEGVAQAIIEIGSGPGILTKHLANKGLPFHLVEKDGRFKEYLLDWVDENQIDMADALKMDMEQLFSSLKWSSKRIWLVSNLPYNVGVPLLIKFIQIPDIKYMTLMFQKEVGEKIVSADDNDKNPRMNSLKVLCQNYFDCRVVCNVPPGAFIPPPKVDSIVLSLDRRKNPEISLEEFPSLEDFVKKIFAFKRKQLGTVLKSGLDKKQLKDALDILSELDIDRRTRAETLELETVLSLYKKLKEI